ncbi:hypothetical protein [Halomicrobium katesii]|uniref:hypothetical protein n=1 Tax=Halomicrobium katesii TaxID=437163 RepID=UPI000378E645|nr:hypothetical protein [Halomicrobium katesii]
MRRRSFVRASVFGLAGVGSLAGCSGSTSTPPRESDVFDELRVSSGTLEVPLVEEPVVESRADVEASLDIAASGLSIVGTARGQKGGGRGGGATGRGTGGYVTAPHGHHGRAIYHGDDDDDEWRDDHRDEIEQYQAAHQRVGLAYLGSDDQYSDDPPGPGPVDWDETWSDPGKQTLTYENVRPGWFRAGSKLEAERGTHDFGWEAIDFEVTEEGGGYQIENPWKVSPRL